MRARTADSARATLAHGRLRLLFFTILAFMVAAPYMSAVFPTVPVNRIAGQLVLIATLSWLRDRPLLAGIGAGLGTVAIVASWIPGPQWIALVGYASEAGFFAVAVTAFWSAVTRDDRVTADALYGAVSVLVLIGLFYAAVYAAIEAVTPGAFTFAGQRELEPLWRQLVYFSFVTLTTLGYGDITPAAPTARSIASVEAATGILYASIVIARLVSLYASGGRHRHEPVATAPGAVARTAWKEQKFSILLAMLLAHSLIVPWLDEAFVGPAALALTKFTILAAGIYAVSQRRSTVVLASLLALPAIIAGTTPVRELAPAWVTVGFLGELAFQGLVIFVIAASVFRSRRVERDTILGAVCVYALLISLWSTAYTFAEWLTPGSFVLPESLSHMSVRLHFNYFSAMTLTTTGFGDISPITRGADMLVTLESLTGIVFPAVLVALLVARLTDSSDAADRGR